MAVQPTEVRFLDRREVVVSQIQFLAQAGESRRVEWLRLDPRGVDPLQGKP